ncbi:MAG TPA: alanine--tRNA ligase [Chitinophagaceae bacterium]|nr:MAG: alanyl-tRNA synthetase [Bacteroidetes bacterium OLB11]HMN33192.1 alanine--tRNA ligase [Chitinophagaceae bacterium]
MTSSNIRKQFLDFFKSKNHLIVPSAPIVIKNDPTLMFTNAGMNQFKNYFLGNETPVSKRVADTQKCLRVSGKHNDLEEVGVDTYHHTMFEMLGNWSFGDYFKAEAIAWSWELLTEIYQLDKSRIYVTIFEGDEKENIPKDVEAYNEWKKVISEDRILLGNKKDNFWEMGDVGPCGPCTEIHYDSRSESERANIDGKILVNADHPQVIEIWNNVFIQYNRKKDGCLENLPAKHVDTGMGFERLVRIIQNKTSNYDTDIFIPIIELIEHITKLKYHFLDSKQDIAFRVLADHIRAISFTIADGQLPSNTSAGYVIRRILRRAVRYYFSFLNYKQPLLHQLLPLIANQFEEVFPALKAQEEFVKKVIYEEELSFLRTLENGLKRIEELSISNQTLNGDDAFELYDTYGFPIDLTQLIATEKGWNVDIEGFKQELQKQKDRSRKAAIVDTEDWIVLDEHPQFQWSAYTKTEATTHVVKYRKVSTKGKTQYQIVLAETPFYAESGGQVGDAGELYFESSNHKIAITDTKKENDLIIHFAIEIPENLSGNVVAKIDASRRRKITRHHSVTHLMHAALREVLGSHVAQKGSMCNDENLRFDFSHFAKLTDDEIAAVERIVNRKIRQNIPVIIKEMPKDEALQLGAMALFGEKYGDVVRVVIMDENFSIELCGGTHVMNTGELNIFKIISETAVAAGVRRVEALAGCKAEGYMMKQLKDLHEVKTILKNPKDIIQAVKQLQDEKSNLQKEFEQLESKLLSGVKTQLESKWETVHDIAFLGEQVEVSSADALKKLALSLKRDANTSYVIALASHIDAKAFVVVVCDENSSLNANQIIKEVVAPMIKGGGGGQKSLATAGGQDASQLKQVIAKIKSKL